MVEKDQRELNAYNIRETATQTAPVVFDESEQPVSEQELLVRIANDVAILKKKLL